MTLDTSGDDDGASSSGNSTTESGADDTGGPPNQPPVADDDGPYVVEAGTVLDVGGRGGILDNDEDPEGATLTVLSWDAITAMGGMLSMNADGGFSYLPPPEFPYGTDSFQYTVADEQGRTDTAEVRVVVQPANGVVDLGGLGVQATKLEGILPSDASGHAATGAGDVDGDGYADILVSALMAGPDGNTQAGEIYLVFGTSNRPPVLSLDDADVRFEGIATGDRAGISVDGAGDVNGDGFADLIIGASEAPSGSNTAGEAYLIFGGAGLPAVVSLADADIRFDGVTNGDRAGRSVRGAGDVNGDGYSDLLIGAYGHNLGTSPDRGETYLVLGGIDLAAVVNLQDADVRLEGDDGGDWAGYSVAGGSDVNGDGYADLLIGAPHADPPARMTGGEISLIFGGPVLPPFLNLDSPDVRFEAVAANDRAGFTVDGLGDITGDGYADIVIGAHQTNVTTLSSSGETYVIFGGPALPPTVNLADAQLRFDDNIGVSASGLGDFNGDGFADVLVGAYNTSPNGITSAGRSHLLLGGSRLGALTSLADTDLHFDGIAPDDHAGWSVGGAGDVDGDGFADLLIGAPDAGVGGETYLLFGDDLLGQATRLGGPDDDELIAFGGDGGDTIIGGRGADTLRADGGPDVLRGGEGDDTLVVIDDSFFRVDGGLGSDVLELSMGTSLSQASLARSRVTGIETILLGPDGSSFLTLDELTLLNLSDTTNTLTVDGDADDQLVVNDGTWFGPVLDGGYDVYTSTSTAAILRVSPAMGVLVP